MFPLWGVQRGEAPLGFPLGGMKGGDMAKIASRKEDIEKTKKVEDPSVA